MVAISEDDVWAVGHTLGGASLTLHWDGTTWSQVGESESETEFSDVDADVADNMWAVGYSGVVERWNGDTWDRFPSQQLSAYAVAVVSSDDVWIAGGYAPEAGMLHWDGQKLVRVEVPTPGVHSSLFSLGVVSATDIWAVGRKTVAGGGTRGLIEHWDGKHWHIRPMPRMLSSTSLSGVSAATADDVYAVGAIETGGSRRDPLTLHWDGTAWTRTV